MKKSKILFLFFLFCIIINGVIFAERPSAPINTVVDVVDSREGSITVLQHMVLPTFSEGIYPDPNKIRSSQPTSIPGGDDGRNAIIKVEGTPELCICYVPRNVVGYTNGLTSYDVIMGLYEPVPPQYMPSIGYVEVVIEGYINGQSPNWIVATAGEYSGTGSLEIQIEGECCDRKK